MFFSGWHVVEACRKINVSHVRRWYIHAHVSDDLPNFHNWPGKLIDLSFAAHNGYLLSTYTVNRDPFPYLCNDG